MRHRNVESVRMTEQTNREHHNGNSVGRVEPSTLQRKTQRKNTNRRDKTWVLRKPGFELKLNHVSKLRLKRKMISTTRRGGEGCHLRIFRIWSWEQFRIFRIFRIEF